MLKWYANYCSRYVMTWMNSTLLVFFKVKNMVRIYLNFQMTFVHLDGLFHLKTQIRRYVGSWLHFWTSRLSAVDTARPTLTNKQFYRVPVVYLLLVFGRKRLWRWWCWPSRRWYSFRLNNKGEHCLAVITLSESAIARWWWEPVQKIQKSQSTGTSAFLEELNQKELKEVF